MNAVGERNADASADADVDAHANADASANADATSDADGATKVQWHHSTWFKRLVIGHAISYAIVLVFAVGWIPVTLRLMPSDELWSETPQGGAHAVLMRLIAPSLGYFLLAHLTTLPWILGKDAARGKRIFISLDVMLFAIALFGGAAAWFLLLYK